MSIINGKYIQPCVYESGLWVTGMLPHCSTESKQLIIKDHIWLKQERKEGIFAESVENEDK
jgi:hypothetical protein